MASQYSSIMNMVPAQNAKASYASRGFGDTQARSKSNAQGTSASFESHLKNETARQDLRSERSNAADSGQIRNVRGTETARSERQASDGTASQAKADNRSDRAVRTDASTEASAEPSPMADDSATANASASDTATNTQVTEAAPAATASDEASEQAPEDIVADSSKSEAQGAEPDALQMATVQPEDLPQAGDLPMPNDQMVAPPAPPAPPAAPVDAEATDTASEVETTDSDTSDAVATTPDDTKEASAGDQKGGDNTTPSMPAMPPVADMPGAVPPPIVADADSGEETVATQPSAPVPPMPSLEGGAEASNAAEQAANAPHGSEGQPADQPVVTTPSETGAGAVDPAALPDDPQPAMPPMTEGAASAADGAQQPLEMPPVNGSQTNASTDTSTPVAQANESNTTDAAAATTANASDAEVAPTTDAATQTDLTSATPSSIDAEDAAKGTSATTETADAAKADTRPAPAETPLKPASTTSEQPDDAMDAIASSQTAEETTDTAAAAVSDDNAVTDTDAAEDTQSVDGLKNKPHPDAVKTDAAVMAAAAAKTDGAEADTSTDADGETAKTTVTAAQQGQAGSTAEAGAQIAKAQGRQTADGQQQPANPSAQASQTTASGTTGTQSQSDTQSATADSDAVAAKPEEHRNAARNAPKGDAFSKMMAMVDDKTTITTNSTSASDLASSTLATASSTVRLTSMDGLAQTGQTAQQISLANSNAIAAEITKFARKGETRFEIRLDPADLGKIDVRMTIGSDGHTRTHLYVERPETLDMLMRDQRFLERSLQQSGVNPQNQSLDYSLMDQGNQGRQMAGQDQSAYEQDYSEQSSASGQPEDTTITAPQTSRYAAHYAATGGLNLVI